MISSRERSNQNTNQVLVEVVLGSVVTGADDQLEVDAKMLLGVTLRGHGNLKLANLEWRPTILGCTG
jgi:hypothetical protein